MLPVQLMQELSRETLARETGHRLNAMKHVQVQTEVVAALVGD